MTDPVEKLKMLQRQKADDRDRRAEDNRKKYPDTAWLVDHLEPYFGKVKVIEVKRL